MGPPICCVAAARPFAGIAEAWPVWPAIAAAPMSTASAKPLALKPIVLKVVVLKVVIEVSSSLILEVATRPTCSALGGVRSLKASFRFC
jgi:hypothetical protein